jgi:outer membrane protein insertion porin family
MAERSPGVVDVTFVVREAEVAKVERIAFRGAAGIPGSRLKDVVSTSESGWFDILRSAAFYDPERIEVDRELVRRHYTDNGFPDARVADVEVTRGPAGGVVVTFVVEEGRPARFGRVAIERRITAELPEAAMAAVAKLGPGGAYDRGAIERVMLAMSEALSKAGLPFARVTPQQRPRKDGTTIDIVLVLDEGPPLYAERIEITGNTRTKDHVVRQVMRLAEGDAVNPHILERARARVMATGFFKAVTVTPAKGSAPDKAVITFAVAEQETGEFGFGAGYSTSEGLVGDVSWSERNLFGNGQQLRLKLAGSLTRTQADVGFTEPRLLGSNVAGGFDLFWKDVDYTKQASYMSWRAGATLRAGVPLDDHWSVGASYTLARSSLYDVGPNASAAIRDAIPGWPANGSATWNISSIGTSVTYDTRDNKRRPGGGVYMTLAQDFAGAGGDVRFVRHVGEARGYYTVADGVTVMGRVQGGQIVGWGGQDVRLLDLFQKSGETVRGFATAGIGPRDTASVALDALGGRLFAATTAEALFDIPGVTSASGLRTAVFADAGSLWGTTGRAATLPGLAGSAPALRASAGVGLAWDSPLGPLRVDYAFPLVKQAYDKVQPFSFGLSPF